MANVVSIGAEGGWVYWINGANLYELELASPPEVTMASGLNAPRSVAVDATHVYFATGNWGVDEAIRRIARGSNVVELLDGVGGAYAITLDATHVYAVDNHGGDVYRIPKDGGVPEVLVAGEPYPFDVVVDSDAVYWSSEVGSAISKVAK
jgi:hypothetical protein